MSGPLSVIAIVLLVVVIVAASIHDAREWAKFSAEHECKVVEKISSRTTHNSDGKSYTEPERTVFLCNDGVRYTR